MLPREVGIGIPFKNRKPVERTITVCAWCLNPSKKYVHNWCEKQAKIAGKEHILYGND